VTQKITQLNSSQTKNSSCLPSPSSASLSSFPNKSSQHVEELFRAKAQPLIAQDAPA